MVSLKISRCGADRWPVVRAKAVGVPTVIPRRAENNVPGTLVADYPRLHGLIATIGERLGGAENSWRPLTADVASLLVSLQEQLAIHFHLEEAWGYGEDSPGAAARLVDLAARLRAEHQALWNEVSVLAEQAAACGGDRDAAPQIRLRLRAFLDQLLEHDALEGRLVIDLFIEDMTGE